MHIQNKLSLKYHMTTLKIMGLIFPLIAPSEQAMSKLFGDTFGQYLMTFFRLWEGAAIIIVVILVLIKKCFGKCGAWASVFCGVLLLSSILQPGTSLAYAFRVSGSIAVIFFLSDIYNGEKFIYYLEGIYYTLTIISLLTSITMFIYYPEGMGAANRYLYALDNVSFIYALHGVAVGFIYNITVHKKLRLRFLLIYIFIGLSYIYTWAATGVIISILCIALVFLYKGELVKKIDFKLMLISSVVIIVFFMIIQNFDLISYILIFLGRDTSLTGRTRIWEVGFTVIKENWLLGIGLSDEVLYQYLRNAGFGWTIEIGHLHNFLLEIAVRGGVLAFVPCIRLMTLKYHDMIQNKKHVITTSLCILLFFSFLTCMFEFRIVTYSFWFLIIMTYHIDDLVLMHGYERE